MVASASVEAADLAARRWAHTFLSYHGHRDARVLVVHAEAILFVDRVRGPMTGWLRRNAQGVQPDMRAEPGFPAEPSAGLWADDDEYEDYRGPK